jgi:hypothetical protein
LWLARLCSCDETLVHLGQLTRVDAGDVIATLLDYERYMIQVEAAEFRRTGGYIDGVEHYR